VPTIGGTNFCRARANRASLVGEFPGTIGFK
jgi:hypothetical protein